MLAHSNPADTLLVLVRRFVSGLPTPDALARQTNLPRAGLTSMGTVKLMLAIEAEFDLAIPDAELTPANFETPASIESLIERLSSR
jgi:acyl carrier protein